VQLGADDSITLSDLLGFSRFLTDTLDNTSAFSNANIKALLNLEYRSLQAKVLAALNYDWKENVLDATGNSSIDLVASTSQYAFPTDMIQIDRIEISYLGTTNSYVVAKTIPMQAIDNALTNTSNDASIQGTKSNPLVYIRDNKFNIDPIPDAAVTDGLKVWGQTLITDLSGSTDEPVFADAFHKLLAYSAAAEWSSVNKSAQRTQGLRFKEAELFEGLVNFYSTRDATEQPVMKAKSRSMI